MIEIPGYVIKREIGIGGMASVHLAVQTSLEREVALKVMAPALAADPVFSKRFLEEARMLASLAHPNIVAVYDVDVSPGQLHYFSMQYLPGGDFNARVKRGLDERELTLSLAGIAGALSYAHKRGYVHCDVSPGNILYDANATPVLTDFGIALASASGTRVTSSGFAVGTSHYMSPEQARGGDVDARSDIYSLGVLAYFGLTGKPPFDGSDGFAVAYAHVFEPIPRLPDRQKHWQPLIDRALAKSPAERYADMEEFLDAMAGVVPAYASLFREEGPAAPAVGTPRPTDGAEPATQRMPAAEVEPATRAIEPGRTAVAVSGGDEPATVVTSRKTEARDNAVATRMPTWLRRTWPVAIVVLGAGLIAIALLMRGGPGPAPPAASRDAQPVAGNAAAAMRDMADSSTPASNNSLTSAPTGVASATSVPAETTSVVGEDYPTVVDPLTQALQQGRRDLAAQRLTLPAGDNAYDQFRFALRLDPHNKAAHKGITEIAEKYIEFARRNLSGGDIGQFSDYLKRAGDVLDPPADYADALKKIANLRSEAAAPLIARGKAAATAWDKPAARAAYQQALQLDPGSRAARQGLKFVATIGEPGFVFRDKLGAAGSGPPMVVLPGSKLAMAQHEVTRGEFRVYWNAAGRAVFGKQSISCRDRESIFRSSRDRDWQHPGIAQNDSHPVVCVTWLEALGYAQWLSRQTGKPYRLPSPKEFNDLERRAPKGDCRSNLADAAYNRQYGSDDGSRCNDGFATTAPAGRFGAIDGIQDIDGNVREWSAACGDGSPVRAGGSCRSYLVKGRSWLSRAAREAPTFSDTYADDVGLNTVGFRVVRDLGTL